MLNFNTMSDAQLGRAVESHYDWLWERMYAPTPFDEASESQIWRFIFNQMDDEYEEAWDEWQEERGPDRDAFEANWYRDHEDEIAEKYNEWYGRRNYDD